MGLNAIGAVSLKPGLTPDTLNERFKNTHEPYDTCLPPQADLIGGLCPKYYEGVEEENAYHIHFDLARYYDTSYARGPWMEIMTQLEWLRAQPEVVAVYYGSDCSDWPTLWTREDSMETLQFFIERGHSSYFEGPRKNWKEPKPQPIQKEGVK